MIHRLNSTDEMLCASGAKLGSSRIVQVLWRFPRPLAPGRLQAEWERLDRGWLSRQPAPAAVPGARRRWMAARNEEPLDVFPEPLAGAGEPVIDWIDAQVRVPLELGSGALWRLAAVRCGSGDLVSLTVPHFRSDGLGIFAALDACRSDAAPPSRSAAWLAGSDAGDALGQAALAVGGALQVLVDRQRRERVRAALRGGGAPAARASAPRFFSSTILEVDAAAWERTAEARGGTVNSLFVEMAANLVRRRVPRDERAAVAVGIPMNLRRSAADGRANALVVVPAEVAGGPPCHGDLKPTRGRVKAVLERSGAGSVTLVPESLWHLLPERWAGRLKAPGAQQTDVVASNFGTVPEGVATFAGQRAESVALRTMNVPGVVPEKARLRASLCLLRAGERVTLTATGMPDHFGDDVPPRPDGRGAGGLGPAPRALVVVSEEGSTTMALPERWFRARPDSSVLERSRMLARSLIDVADLDDQIAFYERLLGVPADLRMPIPNFGGLELAAVGNLLLIASARGFTPIQRQTAFSLIVPSLAEQLERLQPLGVTVLVPVEEIMPGSRARVRYPDGALAELVEHRPQPVEAAVARPAAGGAPGVRLLARRGVPRACFEETVAFYESAFEVGATALDALGSHAVVGSALLVGEDEPPRRRVRAALPRGALQQPGPGHTGDRRGGRAVGCPKLRA